jgi:hypothetical protein
LFLRCDASLLFRKYAPPQGKGALKNMAHHQPCYSKGALNHDPRRFRQICAVVLVFRRK